MEASPADAPPTQPRHPRLSLTRLRHRRRDPADATGGGDSPALPVPTQQSQAESGHGGDEPDPDAARHAPRDRRRRRVTQSGPRESRGDRLARRLDALRQEASRVRLTATGRHYERVGFATQGRRAAAYLGLVGVLGCVAAMSWSGEYQWFTAVLKWTHWHAALGPGSLDLAAMVCSLLALDSIDKGESGAGFRVASAVFVGMGAFINWRTFLPTGSIAEEAFFPVMTVMAYYIVHLVMAKARREARRRQHGLKSRERVEPLPRFGGLVWMPFIGAPGEALDAVKISIRRRLVRSLALASLTPGDAADDAPFDADEVVYAHPLPDGADEIKADAVGSGAAPDLTQMSQGEAIGWVLDNISDAPLVATQYLRENGYPGLASARVTDIVRRRARRLAKTQADAALTQPDAAESGADAPGDADQGEAAI